MAQVSGIEVRIGADASGLQSGLNKAQSAISSFAKGAAAALGVGLSVGAFAAAAKASINFADAVAKSAQKVGTTTKALSELNYAAELSDVSFSELEGSFRFLAKNMASGNDLFQQLGISLKNADGTLRSTDQVFTSLADKLSMMPDGANKTAAAMELLGRGGAQMIPMLNAGAAGLSEMRARAEELGLSISEDTAKRAEKFNDTLTELAAVGQGAMMRLAASMLPVAQTLVELSVAGVEAMTHLGNAISEIAPYAAIATAALAGFYAPVLLAGIAGTTNALGVGLVGAIRAVTAAMMANPIGLLIGGLAAATAAIFVFRDDLKNAIGIDVVGILKDAANAVIRGVLNMKDVLVFGFKNIGPLVGSAIIEAANAVIRGVSWMVNKAIDTLNSLIEAVNSVTGEVGFSMGTIGRVAASEFENTFSAGIGSAMDEVAKQIQARANTDFVGAIGNAVSSAFSSPSTTATAPTPGGTFNPQLSFGSKDAAKTSVNPSQEEGQYFVDRLQAIRDNFKTEREVLVEEYTANQDVLDNALLNKRLSEEEYYSLSRQLAEQHQKDLAAIQATRMSNDLNAAQSFFGSMASIAQLGGKKMIKVQKAIAAAQAIISTIQAAVDAMKNPALIDPASKFAAYAAVLAKGMSAVAAIRGVSDGGGGSGGGRGSGSAGAASSPASSPTTTFQFTLTNDPMGFGEKFARQFIDQLNATQRNGGTIRGVIA